VAKRSAGDLRSSLNRRPTALTVPLVVLSMTAPSSPSDTQGSRRCAGVIGNGTAGWLSTDASTTSSTAAASAKPPVKAHADHPDSGPRCSLVEMPRERAYVVGNWAMGAGGEGRKFARNTYSSDAQKRVSRRPRYTRGAEKRRNSDGKPAVYQVVTESKHCRVDSGISGISTTPGPWPFW